MPRMLTDEQLDKDVLYIIGKHRGNDNAISRWDLCLQVFGEAAVLDRNDLNTYDRQVRRSIERLRRQGHLICNLGAGDGYFLAVNNDEYLRFRTVYGSHAFPIMETIREMDKAAGKEWPNPLQPSLM